MRVLVCDDDKSLRRTLVEMLLQHGLDAVEAAGGYEALTVVRRKPIDLGFFDCGLPDLDGVSTVRKLREEKFYFPFVLMSGEKQKFAETVALPSGLVAFLSKPLGVAEVRQVIREVFGPSLPLG